VKTAQSNITIPTLTKPPYSRYQHIHSHHRPTTIRMRSILKMPTRSRVGFGMPESIYGGFCRSRHRSNPYVTKSLGETTTLANTHLNTGRPWNPRSAFPSNHASMEQASRARLDNYRQHAASAFRTSCAQTPGFNTKIGSMLLATYLRGVDKQTRQTKSVINRVEETQQRSRYDVRSLIFSYCELTVVENEPRKSKTDGQPILERIMDEDGYWEVIHVAI